MNAKTLKALKDSIAHWDRMANGVSRISEEPSSRHCALCVLFINNPECAGCPVAKAAHISHCGNTPYFEAEHWFSQHGKRHPKFKAVALGELAFLRSLLPKRKKG